jgi:hypothetical protein
MANPNVVQILAGQSADVWFGVNMSGSLGLAIRTRDGSNCVPAMWWIKWGFGSVEQLGQQCGNVTIDIPIAWYRGVLSAKLRVAVSVDTFILVSENAAPDAGYSGHF